MMLVENLESRVLFSVGALAHGFGTGGLIDTPVGQNNELISVQTNGAFLVAGSVQNSDNSTHGFIARYHANGSVDNGFGDHGRLDLNSTQYADILSLTIAPDGKIVVVGTDGNGNDVLARFSGSGKVDSHFGTSGAVALPFGAITPTAKIANNDTIIVAANYSATGSSPAAGELIRYTAQGKLDTHFGVKGIVTTDGGAGYVAGDFFIYKNGLVESLFYSPASDTITNPTAGVVTSGPFTALELFNKDGTLDLSFNQNQGPNILGTSTNRFISNGYILSVGSTSAGTTSTTLYYPVGSVDPHFAKYKKTDGQATLPFPANAGGSTDRIVIEPGNNILIVEQGTDAATSAPYIALGGLSRLGQVDHTFGHTGVVQISPAQPITASAGDGSRVLLLENPGSGQPQQILAYTI